MQAFEHQTAYFYEIPANMQAFSHFQPESSSIL